MSDRLDIYRGSLSVPSSNNTSNWGVFVSSEQQIFKNAEEAYRHAAQFTPQDQTKFKSRFKSWIRTDALVILAVFIPDQISWAFNYNPAILWGNKDRIQTVNPETASVQEMSSAQIAASVENLLSQVAYKEKTQVQLKLPNAPMFGNSDSRVLQINSDVLFTKTRIAQVTDWLRDPGIHPLNCGVHALHDILASHNIKNSLEEISVMTLMVDLMNNIVKPGEPKLKTSLYAIKEIVNAYGLDLKAAKLAPKDTLKLTPPFIANLKVEHFVTVTDVDDEKVYFNDIGRKVSLARDDFLKESTGFVLADKTDLSRLEKENVDYISHDAMAFVWGSAWHSVQKEFPGLMSGGDIALQVGIQLVVMLATAGLGALGVPLFSSASPLISLGAGVLAGTLGQWCYVAGECSKQGAMILSTAVSSALSMGIQGGLSSYASGATTLAIILKIL